MNVKSWLILILLLVSACSQDVKKDQKKSSGKKKFSGVKKSHYSDGKILSEVTFQDGRMNGLAKDYYRDGKVHLEMNYKENLKDGLAKSYYQNGNLFEETPYKAGEIHGVQKRFRENGKLASEATYFKGQPCAGLKEYLVDGSLKQKYPEIIVTPVDKILKEDTYLLRLSMSDKSKDVTFYHGNLVGNCLSPKLAQVRETNTKGVSEIPFYVPAGTFIMTELNIVAKVKTVQGNYFVTQRKYNVATENR